MRGKLSTVLWDLNRSGDFPFMFCLTLENGIYVIELPRTRASRRTDILSAETVKKMSLLEILEICLAYMEGRGINLEDYDE